MMILCIILTAFSFFAVSYTIFCQHKYKKGKWFSKLNNRTVILLPAVVSRSKNSMLRMVAGIDSAVVFVIWSAKK